MHGGGREAESIRHYIEDEQRCCPSGSGDREDGAALNFQAAVMTDKCRRGRQLQVGTSVRDEIARRRLDGGRAANANSSGQRRNYAPRTDGDRTDRSVRGRAAALPVVTRVIRLIGRSRRRPGRSVWIATTTPAHDDDHLDGRPCRNDYSRPGKGQPLVLYCHKLPSIG